MLGRIGNRFKWQGMTKDVKEFIRNCKICQLTKHSRPTKLPLQVTSTSRHPFQRISLDIVGPLPTSEEGFTYIMTYQDDLTKYFGACPITNQDANTTAEQLLVHVILRFGMPEAILTDLGKNFVSDIMARTLKLLGIKKVNTSPYHPMTNAGLERCHKTLKSMLRAYINKNKTDWPKFLPYAVFVMNTTINRSTSYSAHELLYSYKIEVPTNLKRKPEPVYSYDDYVAELRFKMQTAHEIAREQQIFSKEQNKQYFDPPTQNVQYKVGDKIVILNNNQKKKLHNLFKGPYTISKIISETNVQYTRGNTEVIIHKNQIKPFRTNEKN